MKTVYEKIEKEINVTPEQAWEVIGAVKGVDQWFGSVIKTCRVEDGKRFCETQDGINLVEDVLEVNHDTKTFRFAIPQQEMLPVENIIEKMKVTESKNGKALIEWSGSFEATNENAPMASKALNGLWEMGLVEMEKFINENQ
jgi:uncharacterized protein YndB with AHSA1/START domain